MSEPAASFDELPPLLATIAAAAGPEVALKIAETHGGTRIKTPTRSDGANWLTALCDRDAAAAIIEALGPARLIDVPLGPDVGYHGSRRAFLKRLQEMLDSGTSGPVIARTLHTTERGVRRWRSRLRARDQRQGELFD